MSQDTVYKFLVDNKPNKYSVASIAKELNLSRGSVSRVIRKLRINSDVCCERVIPYLYWVSEYEQNKF